MKYLMKVPKSEDDLVVAVDIEGAVFLAHYNGDEWYCAITGKLISTEVVAWIMFEPADCRKSTPKQRKEVIEDIVPFCTELR